MKLFQNFVAAKLLPNKNKCKIFEDTLKTLKQLKKENLISLSKFFRFTL